MDAFARRSCRRRHESPDLMHLMQAMQKMSTAFIIEIICALVGFVLAVVGILLLMFVFVAVAASQ